MSEEAIQTYTLKDLLLVLFKPAQLDNFDIAKEWILYVNPRDKHVLLSVIEPEKDRKFPTIATMRYLSTNTLVDHYKMFAKVINVMEPEETVEIAMCSLAASVIDNIEATPDPEATYEMVAYYGLKMINYCIENNKYPFKHLAYTAKSTSKCGYGHDGLRYTPG